jgi:hypothetical protein
VNYLIFYDGRDAIGDPPFDYMVGGANDNASPANSLTHKSPRFS